MGATLQFLHTAMGEYRLDGRFTQTLAKKTPPERGFLISGEAKLHHAVHATHTTHATHTAATTPAAGRFIFGKLGNHCVGGQH